MIASLKGVVQDISDDSLVIDVNGVGYLVFCGIRTLQNSAQIGQSMQLFIRTQARDDDISLYGFTVADERAWFALLQTVQGLGARLALSILSELRSEEIDLAIRSQDRQAFMKVSGVGPRLASRILSELDGRSPKISLEMTPSILRDSESARHERFQQALSALVNLGYARSSAHAALQSVQADAAEEHSLEDLVKCALREMNI